MNQNKLFLCIYLFQIGNIHSQRHRIHIVEETEFSTQDKLKRTNSSFLHRLNRLQYNIQDKVKLFHNEEFCIAGEEKGRCVPIEDCVIRGINNNYKKHKGVFCSLHQQRTVGMCCPNSITTQERYTEDLPAQLVSPSPLISSIVTVSETLYEVKEGSLENLGEIAICGRSGKTVSSIDGGIKPTIKDWPWIAVISITNDEGYQLLCGGTIVSRTHVLTAAHCVSKYKKKNIIVRLGEHDLKIPYETKHLDFQVKKIISHEDFDNITYRHDIALLVLDKPVKYNTYMQPVCFPPPGPRYENIIAVVAGWGVTSVSGSASRVLREVAVPVWEQVECVEHMAQIIYDTVLCAAAYEGGKDSCQGDSGGPLVIQREDGRWAIIGVVSWGNDCGKQYSPGVYTRVNDYLDWIAFYM